MAIPITSQDDLLRMGTNIEYPTGSGVIWAGDEIYEMTNDIVLSGNANPTLPLTAGGKLDGKGFTISGERTGSGGGFFNELATGATVCNIRFKGFNVTNTTSTGALVLNRVNGNLFNIIVEECKYTKTGNHQVTFFCHSMYNSGIQRNILIRNCTLDSTGTTTTAIVNGGSGNGYAHNVVVHGMTVISSAADSSKRVFGTGTHFNSYIEEGTMPMMGGTDGVFDGVVPRDEQLSGFKTRNQMMVEIEDAMANDTIYNTIDGLGVATSTTRQYVEGFDFGEEWKIVPQEGKMTFTPQFDPNDLVGPTTAINGVWVLEGDMTPQEMIDNGYIEENIGIAPSLVRVFVRMGDLVPKYMVSLSTPMGEGPQEAVMSSIGDAKDFSVFLNGELFGNMTGMNNTIPSIDWQEGDVSNPKTFILLGWTETSTPGTPVNFPEPIFGDWVETKKAVAFYATYSQDGISYSKRQFMVGEIGLPLIPPVFNDIPVEISDVYDLRWIASSYIGLDETIPYDGDVTTYTSTWIPKDDPDAPLYKVKVLGGTADPIEGIEGTVVRLTHDYVTGMYFEGWQVLLGDVEVEDNKLTIGTEDIVVQAIFVVEPDTDLIRRIKLIKRDPIVMSVPDEVLTEYILDGLQHWYDLTHRPTDPGAPIDKMVVDCALAFIVRQGVEGVSSASEGEISRTFDLSQIEYTMKSQWRIVKGMVPKGSAR